MSMQQFLDETFPDGARASQMARRDDTIYPLFQMETGRLFCAQATLISVRSGADFWIYEIQADPNYEAIDPDDREQPWRFWIRELVTVEGLEHELWEGDMFDITGAEIEDRFVRLLNGIGRVLGPDGQEVPVERMREYVNGRWEQLLLGATTL
jgi:hypothetical protein